MDNELVLMIGQLYIENYRLKGVMGQLQGSLKEKEGKIMGQEMAIGQLQEDLAMLQSQAKDESTTKT